MEFSDETLGLHERRRRREQDGAVNFSQRRPCPSVRTDINSKRMSAARLAQMTPPETPLSPQELPASPGTQISLFHNYLRAFCHFEQPTSVDEGDEGLLMTASIRPGDLILVHSVHKNGWADGTVLTTGARGWLPTNYCEKFDHPYLRQLLNAMTQFWDLLGAGEDANLSTFVRQDYIRGLIAGVRCLLERANCLHRDAVLVQRNAGIRRMRKGLLADLSTLVNIAKRLQETISEPYAGEVLHVLLDDLVSKAFRVVTRAVGFVDMLAQESASSKHVKPGTPAIVETPLRHQSIRQTKPMTSLTVVTATIDSAIAFPPTPGSEKVTPSQVTAREQVDDETDEPPSAVKFRPPSGGIAHRLSLVARKNQNRTGSLASERLSGAHDECISHIGAFIGLYLHSRPSGELVTTTERLVKACEILLSVVDQVASHDAQRTTSVQQSRTNVQCQLDDLTSTTRDVFRFTDGPDDDVVMLPEQTNHLVNVGTNLIRTVGECVIKTRRLIEQVGDFELETAGGVKLGEGDIPAEAGASDKEVKDEATTMSTTSKRLSKKMLPPPPPLLKERAMTATDVADFARPSTAGAKLELIPSDLHKSLPPPPRRSSTRDSDVASKPPQAGQGQPQIRTNSTSPARKCSVGTAMTGSTEARDSGFTALSGASTRATTPDHAKDSNSPDPRLLNSFGSITSLQSAATTEEGSDVESQLLQKTYANELTLNKDGQVTGGSLAALIEQLTTHDSAPDAQFLSAFFLTFRCFTTPRDLAQALLHRFEYIGDGKSVGTPVRLRIYNVFKGWLEVYWNTEADRDALGDVRYFALHKLKPVLPQAGERLVELTRKVTNAYSAGTFTGPLVSGVGKTSMSIGSHLDSKERAPEPNVTKSQLNMLRNAATTSHITDFDPLEIARQLTVMASKIFCEIQPEELLSLEWTKKNTTKAQNVRQLCILNTDLAHVVGDTILAPDDAKKRAVVIKHWSKIATQCLEMNNYESLMAITCSLNSSVVQRLRRTWELVSKKTKARLDELNSIVDFSRNHASLRRRLEKPVAPCLPFLGVYLTDLTFVDAGNPKMRELPGTTTESGEAVSVINFDKHMRMAKIISHLQKFQVAYKLTEVPELGTWIEKNLQRMREGNSAMVGHLHRRSLVVEPKDIRAFSGPKSLPEGLSRKYTESTTSSEEMPQRPKTSGGSSAKTATTSGKSDAPKFEMFMKAGFAFKSKSDLAAMEGAEEK
ncbi:Ras guanine nucleotide exchange factor bud5 [Saxophila tyrrhenica]|uniref:Ras guanine nucleotide exchange factor bud5 n=1 Tax=Saxophila tyrrhenica TaxID=1690608 RepID=A0AAV9PDS9_9PEZI|nr:Ras guanine nucleotide exchange factor bud5 [Saxophila tyrrhenica]